VPPQVLASGAIPCGGRKLKTGQVSEKFSSTTGICLSVFVKHFTPS